MKTLLPARVPGAALAALLSFAVALIASQPAGATLRTIEKAFELTRSQVQLPGSADGGLTVRQCATCRPVTLRVTAATAWYNGPWTVRAKEAPAGQAAVLEAFRTSAANPRTLVYVYYEPQTQRVKRIVLDVRAAEARR